jgi:cysteinyl-tRNA synthetase
MASKYLGEYFDIHCGGIDHIPDHTNEIAQSEGCYAQTCVNFWLHGELLEVDKGKMSKSTGFFLHLDQVVADGFSPLDYRHLLLTSHYRSRLRFSYENLEAARRSRMALLNLMRQWRREKTDHPRRSEVVTRIQDQFLQHMGNDLHVPEAQAFAWTIARDPNLLAPEKHQAFCYFDHVLGVDLNAEDGSTLTEAQRSLITAREEARRRKDLQTADRLRLDLLAQGVRLRDAPEGPEWEIVAPEVSDRRVI